MISFNRQILKSFAITLTLLCIYATGYGQQGQTTVASIPRLQLDSLSGLSERAKETIDVELEGAMLQIAAKAITKGNPNDEDSEDRVDNVALRNALSGLQGIYVKGFKFTNPGGYTEANIAPIRAQLRGNSTWNRLAEVANRKSDGTSMEDRVEVYAAIDPAHSDRLGGLAVIMAGAKELMIVNIVGSIDLETLSSVAGNFNLPQLKNLKMPTTPPPANQKRQ